MHIKFNSYGKGTARDAANYLLQSRDNKGIERAGIEVLRGDPHEVARVADSLSFVHRYTSGVIAFAPEDETTDNQIEEVLNEFEETAWAGLDPERYTWSAVLHRDQNGGCHIHIFAARVDLVTGKSLNIAPPGWRKAYDPLRDWQNAKHGWARPDDINRMRMTRKASHEYFIDAAALRQGIKLEENPRIIINDYLRQGIESGAVKDRDTILESLHHAGLETPRAGKDYITVRDPDDGKRLRLKGAIYGQSWTVEGSIEQLDATEPGGRRSPDENSAEKSYRECAEKRKQRAEYNRQRYPKPCPGSRQVDRYSIESDAKKDKELNPDLQQDVVEVTTNRSDDLSGYLRGELGADAILVESDSEQAGISKDVISRDPVPAQYTQSIKSKNMGDRAGGWGIGLLYKVARWDKSRNRLGTWRETSNKAMERVRASYDGIREDINRCITGIINAVRRGTEAARRNDQALNLGANGINQAGKDINLCCFRGNQLIQNNKDELSRFKIDINLVEYVQNQGYEIDKRKSCVNSTVMRLGEDKIVIATDVDEHGIYFSMRDDQDNGSIIDFVQNREDLNLGQVRKKLRPWVGRRAFTLGSRRPASAKPKASTADYQKIILEFAKYKIKDQSLYLSEERGLSSAIIKDKRFLWRMDPRGNVVFPHYNNNELTGCEIKNRNFTGFTEAGEKSLWQSTNILESMRIVICESAIDCMSHAQMSSRIGSGYISIAGGLSKRQLSQLQKGLQWASDKGRLIVIATDNDKGGDQLEDKIRSLLPGVKMLRERPIEKDWNKQLEPWKKAQRDLQVGKDKLEQEKDNDRSRGMGR